MKRFEGRVAVVTGASRGLGRAIAVAFASEGAHVVACWTRREADANETARLIAASGGAVTLERFDVAVAQEVDAAFSRITTNQGRIDVLVNNAGRTRDAAFVLMDDAEWKDVLSTNLDGAFHCLRAASRPMIRAKRGAIVNVASVAASFASPGQANYAASKAGLVGLTKTVAAELAPKGIRVNAVVPGLIDAGMVQRLDRRLVERRLASIPSGRLGRPEEIAHATLFLASDDASYIVGQSLVIDGGLTP